MRNTHVEPTRRFTARRAAIAAAVLVALVAATVFVVITRDDLRSARAGLTRSQHNLSILDAEQHDAVGRRSDALAAVDRARDALVADTAARDAMVATNRAQYVLLSKALQTLSKHETELLASAAHAQLLDACLTGASQVLNEAAVGDVKDLASTLPPVQQLCAQAAA